MHPYEKNHIFQFGIRKQIDSSKEILKKIKIDRKNPNFIVLISHLEFDCRSCQSIAMHYKYDKCEQ